ncbi:hypothetical protein CKM354_000271300 [Cercospora kikuchii]|uniref:Zn(2)-C6 fungal-type domain-containing protein n=1 Tax=Cercospora kikuchii TaxID=84275 RepID=A0A9P3CAS7_9PEZI|nr:uncharacterized protein CKM354_000271300 [Cercospora kikuchii]GIZ39326.1 hypothetical protein CKM354_000271300 [Cercospora kikuchii]
MNMESSPASTHASDGAHIKLACQACQKKKIKCDRHFPCGQCSRSSLACVPSQRKPRTRHAGKRAVDSELRSRISKLESLVETLSGEVGVPGTSSNDQEDEEPEDAKPQIDSPTPPKVSKFLGTPFWATLTNEVQALREALEGEDEEEESPESEPTPLVARPTDAASSADLLICPPGSIFVMPGALPEPSVDTQSQLYNIFLANIDPVFKLLHRPTVLPFLNFGDDYLGLNAQAPPNRALKAAIWFASVTSLRDEDCYGRFGAARSDLLAQFRRHCDVALAQAEFINTSDLATLQAAVLYVAAARQTDPSRRPWTLTALIIRVAQGMGLQHEDPNTTTPYEREQRRRLWHQIRVLDAFSSIDRGTEILLPLTAFTIPPPTNVNDDDFDLRSTVITPREEGLSDMTFTSMCNKATNLNIALLSPGHDTWQRRFETTQAFSKDINEKYLRFCDRSRPYDRFLHAVGHSMIASSILRAVRPMQKLTGSVPPRVDSPFVLQLAVNTLKAGEMIYEDPEAEGWRWIFWVQWHALAVALAGLCSVRDTELARTAWALVDKSYDRNSSAVADTRNGMLWRPIEKLYKKAQTFRDGTASTPASDSNSPPTKNLAGLDIANRQGSLDARSSIQLNNGAAPHLAQTSIESTHGLHQTAKPACQWLIEPSVDFSLDPVNNMPTDMSAFNNADMSWDWDRIMEDVSNMPTSIGFSDADLISQDINYNFGNMNIPPDIHGGWTFGTQ